MKINDLIKPNKTVNIVVSNSMTCPSCKGSGLKVETINEIEQIVDCKRCRGEGIINKH
jgi:DnaJ-class molecular chaperone